MNEPSSPLPADFNDSPIDVLIDTPVHEMSAEQLTAYIKRCALMRSSAQSRKQSLTTEPGAAAAKTSRKGGVKKDSVAQAMELLAKLTQQKPT